MDAATVQRERKSGTKCCSAVNAHFLESPSLINNFTNTKGAVGGEETAASQAAIRTWDNIPYVPSQVYPR